MNNIINIPHVHVIFWYRSTHFGGRQPLYRVTKQTGHVQTLNDCLLNERDSASYSLPQKKHFALNLAAKSENKRTQGSFTNEVDRVILCCLCRYLKFLRSKKSEKVTRTPSGTMVLVSLIRTPVDHQKRETFAILE